MLSKFTLAQNQLANHLCLFKCPLCHENFSFTPGGKSLCCCKGHQFDIAKKGYLNLHPHGQDQFYDTALFAAREKLFNQGFFAPITTSLLSLFQHYSPKTILDAGCGDGSHLNALSAKMPTANYWGMDISKQAIQLATNHIKENILWIVGDIANPPFSKNTFDIILNILSPANYPSFNKLLKEEGVLIKVFPGSDYLKELRHLLNKPRSQKDNDLVFSHMEKNTTILQHLTLRDTFELTFESYKSLLLMTPLVASLPKEETAFLFNTFLANITRHWHIVVAKFNH